MNRIKFARAVQGVGIFVIVRKAVQTSPMKRGNYHKSSWTDSPARIKARMRAAGYVLAGIRQP